MKTLFRLFGAVALLSLAGCNVLPLPQGDSVRYFTLSSPVGATVPADAITVRPVQLAGHLRNRAIAVRIGENEVIYQEDARWAESLADAITQTLRNRLSQAGGNFVISVQVQRLEPVRTDGNNIQLVATYSILAPGESMPAKRGSFTASKRTWDGKDFGALVSDLQAAVLELSDAILAALPERK